MRDTLKLGLMIVLAAAIVLVLMLPERRSWIDPNGHTLHYTTHR